MGYRSKSNNFNFRGVGNIPGRIQCPRRNISAVFNENPEEEGMRTRKSVFNLIKATLSPLASFEINYLIVKNTTIENFYPFENRTR